MVHWKQFFYVANIIDYGRVVLLYWAVKSSGYTFVAYYVGSYLLDAFDGMAARALNQESRLGYYLDMVIDRISSCVCLHLAAVAVLSGQTFIPLTLGTPAACVLYGCLVVVEIAAHSAVMILSEVYGVHQKQMGYEFKVVRLYLGDKRFLLFGCASFELLGLGLIVNSVPFVLLGLPGFIFRALANGFRLLSIFRQRRRAVEKTEPAVEKTRPDESGRLDPWARLMTATHSVC